MSWGVYVESLKSLANSDLEREREVARIQAEYHESGSRLRREQEEQARAVVAVRNRAGDLRDRVSRLAASVGAVADAPPTRAPTELRDVTAALADADRRVAKVEASKAWLDRARQADLDRAARPVAMQPGAPPASMPVSTVQTTPPAPASRSRRLPTAVIVVVGAIVLLVVVVVIVVAVAG